MKLLESMFPKDKHLLEGMQKQRKLLPKLGSSRTVEEKCVGHPHTSASVLPRVHFYLLGFQGEGPGTYFFNLFFFFSYA